LEHIIIDTDPGVDDALALMLALRSPELYIEAITTVAGNVGKAKGHKNAEKILEFLEVSNIPVCSGAKSSLFDREGDAEEVHGITGLGEADLTEPKISTSGYNAVEMIKKKAEELVELTLVAIGPLTNIAIALSTYPYLAERLKELIIMGGAYHLTPYGYGNVNPTAEFNIWYDPEAAKIVFNSGLPFTAVGLDVTNDPDNKISSEEYVHILKMENPRAKLVGDLCRGIVEWGDGISLHDPMALIYLLKPEYFHTLDYYVDVETQGILTRGMTVIDRRRSRKSNAKVVTHVDSDKFLSFFRDRVIGG
jgi:inosine-uridine nucleoside N-ribohydrolase